MNKIVKARKRHYKGLLKRIHRKIKRNQLSTLTEEEQKLYDKFNEINEPNKFYRATYRKRMRMQVGQSNNFVTGIKNSGKYLPFIEDIFNEAKLPVELTRLIFVESMFNLRAYSKVGASGIWQFMRYTGKRFLEISFAVDERRDPITATHAAAKLLTANHKRLKTWPLAITAYNHGARGMERAARRVGTTNFIDIIDKYKSRTFGFASKNFYAQFLAAVEVESNQKFYFGEIEKHQPVIFKEFMIPDFLSFSAIPKHLDVSTKIIQSLNPALKSEVYSGHARIPKGYKLKVPLANYDTVVTKYAEIPQQFKHKVQKRRKYYRVKRGDSLWTISRRYRVSLRKLKNINNIRNHRRIRPGQLLILP
jgi:membrane-bound lytic murein transglycosylase D